MLKMFTIYFILLQIVLPRVYGFCEKCPNYDLEYKLIEIMVNLDNCYDSENSTVATMKTQLRDVLALARSLDRRDTMQPPTPNEIRVSSTYIRWGRTTCPGRGSELLYDGYAAGSSIHHQGGGANRLCLPKNPSWDKYNDNLNMRGGSIFAAFYAEDIPGQANKTVACAVCKVNRPTIIMIPARNVCPFGWTLEYNGYLSTGRSFEDKSASEFLCLDGNMEGLGYFDGLTETNRAWFSLVEARCPSSHNLECPPYVHLRELTCVVCSTDG